MANPETPQEEKQEQPAEETPVEDKTEDQPADETPKLPAFGQLSIEKADNGYLVFPRETGETFVFYSEEEVLEKVKELLARK